VCNCVYGYYYEGWGDSRCGSKQPTHEQQGEVFHDFCVCVYFCLVFRNTLYFGTLCYLPNLQDCLTVTRFMLLYCKFYAFVLDLLPLLGLVSFLLYQLIPYCEQKRNCSYYENTDNYNPAFTCWSIRRGVCVIMMR